MEGLKSQVMREVMEMSEAELEELWRFLSRQRVPDWGAIPEREPDSPTIGSKEGSA